jgi:hypothetical protein
MNWVIRDDEVVIDGFALDSCFSPTCFSAAESKENPENTSSVKLASVPIAEARRRKLPHIG